MGSKLGNYVQNLREQAGIKRSTLVTELGFNNVNKGCRLLVRLEREGDGEHAFVLRVLRRLNADLDLAERLAAEDEAEIERQLDEELDKPITPHVMWNPMPAVGVVVRIPPEAKTQDEMEAFASKFARDHVQDPSTSTKLRVCLVLTRRLRVWFRVNGEVYLREVVGAADDPTEFGSRIGKHTLRYTVAGQDEG